LVHRAATSAKELIVNLTSLMHSTQRRRAAGALAGVAAITVGAVAFGGAAGATTTHPSQQKPTIVLEHGAFADGSSWNGVIGRLQKAGYPVIASATPLRSVSGDAAALRSVVDHVEGPVILVGHSYGGSVISAAAADEPQVKALVYVAAFLPDTGENALGLTNKFPGSTLADTLDPVPFTQPDGSAGTDLYIKADKFRQQFAADVPAGTAALLAATQRPVAQSALEETATTAAWKSKPSWDLITTQDRNIPPAAQRFMAQRAHAHTTEVKASHSVAVSHPEAVVRVIEQAAHATER
jgi:pimeloyl-ACP methyl ester carboxylesterase